MSVKNTRPFCVGLTGGIGSGKTTVSTLFKKKGVSIIDADEISHQLTQINCAGYEGIVKHFGPSILSADKKLNRQQLRNLIFENPNERKWLENFLHPLIRQTMREMISSAHSPYCICVIPLLAESSGIDFIDHVLVVDTDAQKQIERAKTRDAATPESIQKIIDAQASQMNRLAIADDVLKNNGDINQLEDTVEQLHQKYLAIASKANAL